MYRVVFGLLLFATVVLLHRLTLSPAPAPAASPPVGRQRRRRCPFCGAVLPAGDGLRGRTGADGTVVLLGCAACLDPSERR